MMNQVSYNSLNNNCFESNVNKRINNIHFVGIGGSGMNGIAEVLHNLGFNVTGSDLHKTEITNRLIKLGIQIVFSHIPDNVMYCDALVTSSAIPSDNIEILTAKKRKIPVIHRAQMLAELMRFKYGIAIAGSHGKTTTTSLIATILAEAGKDPTFVVGGQLNKFSSNAKLGSGKFFVSEADESDGSFLYLNPLIAIITNIDNDHLVNYGQDFNNLKQAFLAFTNRLPFYGLAVVCRDDPEVTSLMDNISRPLISYGFSPEADLRAISYRQQQHVSYFEVLLPGSNEPKEVILNLPGKHNVLNALAAIAVALELNITFEAILQTLKNFHGIDRRFKIHGQFKLSRDMQAKFWLLDDYGHHPSEILAVITAIQQGWVYNKLILVFQPHRYTRTKQLFSEFIKILALADYIILLDIYSAGEEPIDNISSQVLGEQITKEFAKPVKLLSGEQQEVALLHILRSVVQDGDLILMQGAGDLGKITVKLINALEILEDVKI